MADNPPAYPSVCLNDPNHPSSIPGMTLRDWFAGQAISQVIDAYIVGNGPCLGTEHMPRNAALHAYRIADAMLAEREKRGLK